MASTDGVRMWRAEDGTVYVECRFSFAVAEVVDVQVLDMHPDDLRMVLSRPDQEGGSLGSLRSAQSILVRTREPADD